MIHYASVYLTHETSRMPRVVQSLHPEVTPTDILTTPMANRTIESSKAVTTKQQVVLHVEA